MSIDFAGWVQAAVASGVACGGVIFIAGTQKADLANTKQQVMVLQNQQQTDHDNVTDLKTQVKDIKDDVSEIKQDVKTLLRK